MYVLLLAAEWLQVRAMELIDELEPTQRGPYSGGIGGISFTGDMDMALALRTMVFPASRTDTIYSYKDVNHRREWVVHIQVHFCTQNPKP